MAISETTLKDTMLTLVDRQNEAGGVLGCEIEAVVVDPASDWPLFAERAGELLTVNEVDVIFGNRTSVSRKSVLPMIEELNGLLYLLIPLHGLLPSGRRPSASATFMMTGGTGIDRSADTGVARIVANQSRTSCDVPSATCRPRNQGRICFRR